MEDDRRYVPVKNEEEQYSIWPADKPLPGGWRATARAMLRDECLDHVEEAWTDMRPASLRRALETSPGSAA